MKTPRPHLRYMIETRPTPVDYLYGDIDIHTVCEVTASDWRGALRVTVSGPMRKKDGTRGRHWRGSQADPDAWQPDWLKAIIDDARRRLS